MAADRGGNDVEVRFFGYTTNLHALWDVYLPAGFIRDWQAYADAQLGNIDEHQRQLWSGSNASEWAADSQRLVHSHA
ncbi:S1/P1 nuclease [Microbulbifer marinus]|uniref:S1/P1 nuclease n=1 Tax=Microbulbifer marinus TaxID=658218 RepID=UPI003CC7A340